MSGKEQDLNKWIQTNKYLPFALRDFHDQKNVFKCLYKIFSEDSGFQSMPNSQDAHVFTIDYFLYFMALHGYTLQKSQAKVEFCDLERSIADMKYEQVKIFQEMFLKDKEDKA